MGLELWREVWAEDRNFKIIRMYKLVKVKRKKIKDKFQEDINEKEVGDEEKQASQAEVYSAERQRENQVTSL